MTEPRGRHLILRTNRPQYVAAPEVFACELAWSGYTAPYPAPANPDCALALMYEGPMKSTKTVEYRLTRPSGDAAGVFADALAARGLRASAGEQDRLSESILDGLRGVMARRSHKQAASPMTPSLALLCNSSGFSGNRQPPEVGNILDQIFSLGLNDPADERTASGLWRDAMGHMLATDPLTAAIDESMAEAVMTGSPAKTPDPGRTVAATALPWRGLMRHTPAAWFSEAWSRVTDPRWVAALPPRVWADWATTVLRMAFGMTFLWEATWYETIARRVQHQQGAAATWEDLRGAMPAVLPWAPSSASTGIRDISSRVSRRAKRAPALREHLNTWIEKKVAQDWPVADVLAAMGADGELCDALRSDLSKTRWSSRDDNYWEAIRFALQIREDSGPYADYYGLIRATGKRWATLEPATEWIAVIASLSAGAPGSECDLGRIVGNLDDLGLQPDLTDLIALLERAGLARGSADADLGVRVGSAYS